MMPCKRIRTWEIRWALVPQCVKPSSSACTRVEIPWRPCLAPPIWPGILPRSLDLLVSFWVSQWIILGKLTRNTWNILEYLGSKEAGRLPRPPDRRSLHRRPRPAQHRRPWAYREDSTEGDGDEGSQGEGWRGVQGGLAVTGYGSGESLERHWGNDQGN